MSHATTPIPARLAARLRQEGARMAARVAKAREGEPDAVHRARVSSRRLREMLAIAESVGAPGAASALRDARRVGRALGPIREIDVSRGVWQEASVAARWPPSVIASLDRQTDALRRRHLDGLQSRLSRPKPADFRRRLHALSSRAGDAALEPQLRQALARRVRQRAQTLVQAIDAAGTVYAIEPLHQVRIAVKKLRYAAELVRDLARVPIGNELGRLRTKQDMLGRLHDLQVVQHRLQAAAGGRRTTRAALRALEAASADLERECRTLHARFVASAPKLDALARGLGARVALALVRPRARRMAAAPGAVAAPDLASARGGGS
jgi:CHAD domain-containing protein